MKKLTNIIVHCSDSEYGNVNVIRQWHKQRGWKDIGYHFVILNGNVGGGLVLPALDGSIECGRPIDGDAFIEDNEIGAHALGYNDRSIGICVIGIKKFTPSQLYSLESLLANLVRKFGLGVDDVLGHYETESGKAEGKTCPNMDMSLVRLMVKKRLLFMV